ncbi:SRSO17 transposase [Streptosporangium album]|uniref:SRSO17 transposase n=1 Tax=Streptosporangium album TaxID=47479 RepID=A0A7W7RZA3_9ACTN|nr:SRSO17 transposase [Streptosporangium album]
MAAGVTVAHERWPGCFAGLMDRPADCFPRRETRLTCRNMIEAMLAVEGTANCWTLGEAIGHRGPHILRHFLPRARWDERTIRIRVAAWAIDHLGTEDVVPVVDEIGDETGDEKSSTDAVGAARQYSGTLGGVPEEVMFATKPQLPCEMLTHARERGVIRAWVAADEVYGGRACRMTIREVGYSYVIAVKSDSSGPRAGPAQAEHRP